jgi:hypothetical protein
LSAGEAAEGMRSGAPRSLSRRGLRSTTDPLALALVAQAGLGSSAHPSARSATASQPGAPHV